MKAPSTLALILTGGAASPDGVELLRMVAALVAADQPVGLICAGPGRGAFERDDLSAEAQAYLDGVADFGVIPAGVDDTALLDALEEARDIMRVAPADRPGDPALLVIDDAWLAAARGDPAAAVAALAAAGQVIRE